MRKKLDIPFGRPWITDEDRNAVMKVLKGHILTHGPMCANFESAFVDMMGDGFATTTSSCMAALHLSNIHIGLGPSDEVVVPAMTHVATVHAVELTGATPVFVDCELHSGNLKIAAIEAAITERTKSITVVHFNGIPCDMRQVMQVAERHNLSVVEDCALAVGARIDGRHVGLFGDTGCYSFYPVKHITTGDGGMLVSRHEDVVGAISRFRAFNVDKNHAEREIPGLYDIVGLGMNYRMSEMQAALGSVQLGRVPEILKRRAENFHALKEGLSQISGLIVLDSQGNGIESSYYCLTVVLSGVMAKKRDDMVLELNKRGIGTSIYYPHPVPRLSYYRAKYGYDSTAYLGAEAISDHSIALPVGPHLDPTGMTAITDNFCDIVDGLTGS